MAAHGLDPTGLARHALDGIAEGELLTRELLAEPDPPSAVVCASDPLAIGAWRAGEQRTGGLAAIGFDDTPMAQAAGLSSVRQPLAAVATECIRTLALVLSDRLVAPAPGSRSADTGARLPRQSTLGQASFDTSTSGNVTTTAPAKNGRSPNTTYNPGGGSTRNDPSARRVLLEPHLVVRDSG